MRATKQLKTRKRLVAVVLFSAFAATGLLAVWQQSGKAGTQLSVRHGTPVPSSQFSATDLRMLSSVGATDDLSLLAERNNRAYYKVRGAGGETCYAVGAGTKLLGAGCLHGADEIPTPIVDLSAIVLDPRDRSIVKFSRVEGIAADQVAEVALESADGTQVTTSVSDNVYQFEQSGIPRLLVAIVALDASGNVLQTISVPPR